MGVSVGSPNSQKISLKADIINTNSPVVKIKMDRVQQLANAEHGNHISSISNLTRSTRSLAKSQAFHTSMASIADLAVMKSMDNVALPLKNAPKKDLFNQKDQGWAWMIVLACFLLRVFIYGVTNSTGILNVVFLEVFKGGKGETAIVSSLIMATGQFTGTFAGIMMNRFGGRVVVILSGILATAGLMASTFAESIPVLTIGYGVVTGLGFGLCQVPASVVIAQYFDKKRNLALGLASSGGGFGSLIFPFILQWLLSTYGWRGTLLICGGLCLHICMCGVIMRPFEEPLGESESIESDSQKKIFFHFEVIKNVRFLILCLNNFLYAFGASVIFVHLVSFAESTVVSDSNLSALLLTCLGGANLVGKIGLGVLAHHPRVAEQFLYLITTGSGGIATLIVAFYPSYWMLVLYASWFGLSYAALGGALIPSILVTYTGVDSLASSYGFLLFFQGLGFFTGAPTAGWVYDVSQNFSASLVLGGVITILSALLVIVPWKCMAMCDPRPPADSTPEQAGLMTGTSDVTSNGHAGINGQKSILIHPGDREGDCG